MGFGILFIGYFLLLNVTSAASYSNLIAALIMLLGLNKLARINSGFKFSLYICVGFAFFSFFDLAFAIINLLKLSLFNAETFIPYFFMVRMLFIGSLTFMLLRGIHDVATEVDLARVPKRCRIMSYASLVTYALAILLTEPGIAKIITTAVATVLSAIVIFAMFIIVIINLYTIYVCFGSIGMPGENNHKEKKPSKFAFVNEMRERREERERANVEYKLAKFKVKAEKQRNKKK